MTRRTMWDSRYAGEGYLFGTEPAAFLRAQAHHLPEGGEVLSVADGEGRNAVWLSAIGHSVTAFDASPVAIEKARLLAETRGQSPEFHVASVEDWDWTRRFDAIVAIFVQFAGPALREIQFAGFRKALRPGGVLLLHGYAPRQVFNGTGGPPHAENMYTPALLREAFAGWEILRNADYDAEIQEGEGHSGPSALVDFVAVKPL